MLVRLKDRSLRLDDVECEQQEQFENAAPLAFSVGYPAGRLGLAWQAALGWEPPSW